MSCYKPLKAYLSHEHKTKNGKAKVYFDRVKAGFSSLVELPCGQCLGCRIDKSREWALRCVHESSCFENNCFITLTFCDSHLRVDGSLVKRDFQLFMKRLRKRFTGIEPVVDHDGKKRYPIRYFHCGEYGAELQRPHHHACLFNFDFPDKVIWSVRDGVRLFRSALLEELWPYGFCTIGDVTFESAAYVARYVTKKITGDAAASHYLRVVRDTGELVYVLPEYITMSRRPGIGKAWFERFNDDVFPKDFVTSAGKVYKVPSYYDKLYDSLRPEDFLKIKKKRLTSVLKHSDNNTSDRLRARLKCKEAQVKRSCRSYEDGITNV